MKQPVRIILLIISLLSISASNSPEDGASETIQAGLLRARVGENGWYTSDVVIPLLFPPGVTANGQPVPGGQLTVSAEGRHEIQLAPPGPHGADNAVTQFVNIDKSAPLVSWITAPNTLFSGRATLSADVTDEVSGIGSIEVSFDHGSHWTVQRFPDDQVYATRWSIEQDVSGFKEGAKVILLRARDRAGNVSPGEILVVRVKP